MIILLCGRNQCGLNAHSVDPNSMRIESWSSVDRHSDLPTVPYFPGQYQKNKPCLGVPNVCSKIPEFDGPDYGVKYLCATRKRDRPDRVNCVRP